VADDPSSMILASMIRQCSSPERQVLMSTESCRPTPGGFVCDTRWNMYFHFLKIGLLSYHDVWLQNSNWSIAFIEINSLSFRTRDQHDYVIEIRIIHSNIDTSTLTACGQRIWWKPRSISSY